MWTRMELFRFSRFVLVAGVMPCLVSCGSEALQQSEDSIVASPRVPMLAVLTQNAGLCPTLTGWSSLAQAPGLERYCEYLPDPSSSLPFPSDPDIERADPVNIGRVKPQNEKPKPQTALSQRVGPWLGALFDHHANIPDKPLFHATGSRARLAIVDTKPEGTAPTLSKHAPSMEAIARRIGCSGAGCAFELKHYLGLPRDDNGVPQPTTGGYYGTLWELAKAIALAAHEAPNGTPLVINLSLGWDRGADPLLPDDHERLAFGADAIIPAPTRAVHAALYHARCQGALIFAASGNDDGMLKDRSGPLLPAAWSALEVPASCVSAGATKRPLVFAVGGVGATDERLENARPGSTPQLVAPASGARAPGSEVLTGTSVSAVIAAATAAMVRTLQPQLSADDVYALVLGSAQTLTARADFCDVRDATLCPQLRRISVCHAQVAACGGSGYSCAPGDCDNSALPRPYPRGLDLLGHALSTLDPYPLDHAPAQIGPCGDKDAPLVGQSLQADCSRALKWTSRELDTSPQPHDPVCPACIFGISGGSVSTGLMGGAMNLTTTVPGGGIHEPYLVVRGANQGEVVRYSMGTYLPKGFAKAVTKNVAPLGFTPKTISLEYELVVSQKRFFQAEPLLMQ